MLTFLALVFIVVSATYFFSKKMLVEPAPLMKPLPRAPEPVVQEEVAPVVAQVKKPRKKTAPKSKKISSKKKAE